MDALLGEIVGLFS